MNNLENGKTARVVFGGVENSWDLIDQKGWKIYNPMDFLST